MIKPIDGADDGASGVGVLLQIAKTIQENPIDLGVDIIFFDAEDNGIDADKPEDSKPETQNAPKEQDKIWTLAGRMGYGDLFQKKRMRGGITDDHVYMDAGGVPSVDIINYPGEGDGFGHYHHTHDDNMDNIDKNTLRRVGQVVTAVLYKESEGSF